MTELEKAGLAIMVTRELLNISKKILAIKIIRFMYKVNLKDAKEFADNLESGKTNG